MELSKDDMSWVDYPYGFLTGLGEKYDLSFEELKNKKQQANSENLCPRHEFFR